MDEQNGSGETLESLKKKIESGKHTIEELRTYADMMEAAEEKVKEAEKKDPEYMKGMMDKAKKLGEGVSKAGQDAGFTHGRAQRKEVNDSKRGEIEPSSPTEEAKRVKMDNSGMY